MFTSKRILVIYTHDSIIACIIVHPIMYGGRCCKTDSQPEEHAECLLLYLFGAFGLQTGVELTTVSKHGDGKTWPGTKGLA